MSKSGPLGISTKKRGRPRKPIAQVEPPVRGEQPLAYSVPRSAKTLGVGRTKLYELLANNELSSFCIGTRRLIAYSELVKFIEAKSGA